MYTVILVDRQSQRRYAVYTLVVTENIQ